MDVVQLLGSRDPDGAKYTGKPGAMGAGNMVLIGFSLASGSSAPVRTKHGGSTAPGQQGPCWLQAYREASGHGYRRYGAGRIFF